MEQIRIYSRKWLHDVVDSASNIRISAAKRLKILIDDITDYLDYLDELDRRRVSSKSERKAESSRNNGKKGGRPRKQQDRI